MASQIYLGQLMHQRFFPMKYQFRYTIFSLRVDIDKIEQESQNIKCLSLNRLNLFSLHYSDYGARQKGRFWRVWADNLLAEYGLQEPAHKIDLVCFPRFMNITFNPLAMWYAYNQDHDLIAIICEVSNTFGQWHHYVLTDGGKPLEDKVKAKANKVFHVSPFIGMNCQYQFKFTKPTEQYKIAIFQFENKQSIFHSIQVGKAKELNNANLLKCAVKHPFNTLKVLIMIHWWAIKIWLKGGQFHCTPKQLEKINYSHTEMKLC